MHKTYFPKYISKGACQVLAYQLAWKNQFDQYAIYFIIASRRNINLNKICGKMTPSCMKMSPTSYIMHGF